MSFLKHLLSKEDKRINSYTDFWAWFQTKEKDFYKVVKKSGNFEKDFFKILSPKLSELRDGYFYLTGMLDDSTAELVLTADGKIKNFVFVEELVKAAPFISGWKFTAHKPAIDINDVNIEMSGFSFKKDNLSFHSIDNPYYPDEIEITIVTTITNSVAI